MAKVLAHLAFGTQKEQGPTAEDIDNSSTNAKGHDAINMS